MGLRERRLVADALEMGRFGNEAGRIVVLGREGNPPERYTLEYRVRSLAVKNGEVVPRSRHRVEIFLTLAYPRQAPQCRMLTPVFHPNIAPHAICIGDHWTAGESLAALCVRIAEMLSFQSYNVKSPLNGEAAQWVEQNLGSLPLEKTDFRTALAGEVEDSVIGGTPAPTSPSTPEPSPTPGPDPVRHPAASGVVPPAPPPPPRDASGGKTEVTCPRCSAALSVVKRSEQPWARCPLCGTMIPVP